MTNPINLPPLSQPCVDLETGIMNLSWYNVLLGFFTRTGGVQGTDSTTVAAQAAQALLLAGTAETTAQEAYALGSAAQGSALDAISKANTAISMATAASGSSSNGLLKNLNLSDLVSASNARQNLSLDLVPFTQNYGIMISGEQRFIPLIKNYVVPGNFSGSLIWANTIPTANATFVISYIRGVSSYSIGNITIINGGSHYTILSGNQTNLIAGDVLVIQSPSPADITMRDIGLTIAMINA